jgi:hypothetical protein
MYSWPEHLEQVSGLCHPQQYCMVQSNLRRRIQNLIKTSDSQLGIHIPLGAREQLKEYTKRQILLKFFFGDTQILKG